MRSFVIISVVVHLALLVMISSPYERQTAHGETMSVELVPSNEAPAFNDEPAMPDDHQKSEPQKPQNAEAMPDFSKLRISEIPTPSDDTQQQKTELPNQPQTPQRQKQVAQPQPELSQQKSAQQPSPAPKPQAEQSEARQQQASEQPAPAQPAPDQSKQDQPTQDQPMQDQTSRNLPLAPPDSLAEQGERLAALVNVPGNGLGEAFGSAAETGAKLSAEEIAQFQSHLKTCWTAPAGVGPNQKVTVVIRIALQRDGSLAAQPTLIEAAASEMGLPVYKSGVAALKKCAPYTMLPVEKYKEWQVLDIDVSPDKMGG